MGVVATDFQWAYLLCCSHLNVAVTSYNSSLDSALLNTSAYNKFLVLNFKWLRLPQTFALCRQVDSHLPYRCKLRDDPTFCASRRVCFPTPVSWAIPSLLHILRLEYIRRHKTDKACYRSACLGFLQKSIFTVDVWPPLVGMSRQAHQPPFFILGRSRIQISARRPGILKEVFMVFVSSSTQMPG